VAEGAKVVIGDVLEAEGEAVAHDLGSDAVFVKLDVTSEASWQEAVAATVDAYGGLHVLVNNAGVLGAFTPLVDTTIENFMRVLSINLVGTFLGIKTGAPALRDSGGGSIVNISSTGGLTGLPFVGAYVASKWGVRGLTKSAALDLGKRGIRVNSVHPGGIDTEMTRAAGDGGDSKYYKSLPVSRMGTVDDVAKVVLFLASDDSSYCSGAEFAVDGGATCGDRSLFM
jgi:3alpha(or 20beta)-hydroxysteroid dehydrogenase